MEETNRILDVDLSEETSGPTPMEAVRSEQVERNERKKEAVLDYNVPVVNCLRNDRIIVRHVPKKTGFVTDPKHILSGGMADTAKRTFCVPKLSSGIFVNVLTDNEKDCLEQVMGLEKNALSIYRKVDNFWDGSNPNSVNTVTLFKQDNYLDLSTPEDYIKYKILLANKDFICPSLKELELHPKRTYQFVIIDKGEEARTNEAKIDTKQKCYMEFGKIDNNVPVMAMVVQMFDKRPVSITSEPNWLKTRIDSGIMENPKRMLSILTDPLLETKVILKKAIQAGMIVERGNYLYYTLDGKNEPMCEEREEPTFDTAAVWLSNPRRQEIKFRLEELLK